MVTGSSRGIGKAIALALGAAGARVRIHRTSTASSCSARPVLLSPATSPARKPEVDVRLPTTCVLTVRRAGRWW